MGDENKISMQTICFNCGKPYGYHYGMTCHDGGYFETSPAAITDTKPSNPKQAMGDTKLPLHLVPATMEAFAALAFLEGGLKYGAHNYKAVGVRASTYYSAVNRHLKKWWSGQWADPKTGIPHLSSALAGVAILADATVSENLTDDRPPATKVAEWIDAAEPTIAKVKALYGHHTPKHYTIADPVRKGE